MNQIEMQEHILAVRFLPRMIGAALDALNPFRGKRLKGKPVYSQQKEWVPFRWVWRSEWPTNCTQLVEQVPICIKLFFLSLRVRNQSFFGAAKHV
jgi:hypothetical protein